jgi:hypothetical protein
MPREFYDTFRPRFCSGPGSFARRQPIVEIFDLPVLNALVQLATALERSDCLAIGLVLVGVDHLGRAFSALPRKRRADFAVLRGDNKSIAR